METLDPRSHPYRADLASAHLKGKVRAERFVEPNPHSVIVPVADVYAAATPKTRTSQIRLGEVFHVYDSADGYSWGQCGTDGYVGYVATQALGALVTSNRSTTALSAHTYSQPDMKSFCTARLPFDTALQTDVEENGFVQTNHGWVHKSAFIALDCDPVSVAEQFLSVPYLWGGRSSFGLDCSALVQVMMTAAEKACPRDSDMQTSLGKEIQGPLCRGDLVFWKGHVGIMQSATHLLHANAHHMAVVSEPLNVAIERILPVDGPVTAQRRVL